jgi:mycoredoxin
MPTIRMYHTTWCPDCWYAKRFLDERSIAYESINVDEQPEAASLIIEKNNGKRKVPTFEVEGRWFSASPFNPDYLAEQLNLS